MPDYIYLLENRLSPSQQNALRQVRDAARDAGMTVFLAGGAVRDLTSGFPVRDLDFSVQGNAVKLRKPLEKAGATLWGEHEPSRTLFFWFPGSVRVEVSSARREEYPKPGKPVYQWAPILEDLRRRDFTANAMAISLNEGSWGLLLDPLNGFADIETRHLRLASNYGFIEDPSRMLRAIRLAARTGWEMEERTKARYQNAKDEGLIDQISPYARGYELEEIGHEEDPLKALEALEAEGWMNNLCPSWTIAKADLKGLEELNQTLIHLMMLGVNPDPSAAHMELLTAKMPPKDVAGLKRLFPRQGFVEQWNHLEQSAKDFAKELLNKSVSTPSATWKLIVGHQPEAVLWLAYSSKNAQVREKFNNFFKVWPEAKQKIPTALMADMRITPDLPEYGKIAEELFFQLMDGKLQSEEEIRAFLEPHSPPAPPPPVVIRRPRGRRAEPKIEEEEELDRATHDGSEDEESAEDEGEHEELPERLPEPALVAAGEKATPKAAKDAEKTAPATRTQSRPAATKTPEKPAKPAAKPEPKSGFKAAPKSVPERKPEAKTAAKKPDGKAAAKPAKAAAKATPKKQASVGKTSKAGKVAPGPSSRKAPKKSSKPSSGHNDGKMKKR